MLSLRLLVSAILIPLAIGLFWLDATLGPAAPIFGPLTVILGSLMANEMVTMLRGRVPKLSRSDVVCACGAIIGIGWAAHAVPKTSRGYTPTLSYEGYNAENWSVAVGGWAWGDGIGAGAFTWLSTVSFSLGMAGLVATFLTVIWLVIAALRIERGTLEIGEVISILSAKLFIIAYVAGCTVLTSQIRWISEDSFQGMRALAALLIGTKLGDVGGYFTGRFLGKTKPLKVLSPNKTIAGFAGAIISGAVGLGLWLWFTDDGSLRSIAPRDPEIVVIALIAFGVAVALLGILGDLVESLIKRDSSVKDASQSLPGFGGVLDLLDSPIFTGAVLVATFTTFCFLMLLIS